MSEIVNKTILELTPLTLYLESDAIPILRPNLNEDNCITLGNIIWFNTNTNQLIINGRYKFDMSSLLQANISIKLTGDSGITNFTYNGQTYSKGSNIESSEDSLTTTITANVDSHYTFNKWQFNVADISTFHTPDSPNVLNYTFTIGGELSASTTPNKYTITVNTNNALWGNVSGGGSYDYNTSHTITATPNSGYKFVRWTKNGSQVSTNPSYTFTVTNDATYIAVFEVEGPPDYYVGQHLNKTSFENATDNDIINSAEGEYLSITPIYPSTNGYSMFTGNNKLMYVLVNQSINVNLIKVDTENPGGVDPVDDDFTGENGVFKDEQRTIAEDNVTYKVYRVYNSNFDTQNGYRIKFNQTL